MGKRTPARALNESLGIIAVNAKKIMWKCFRSAQLARYALWEGAQLAKNDDALILKDRGACVAGKRAPTDSLQERACRERDGKTYCAASDNCWISATVR